MTTLARTSRFLVPGILWVWLFFHLHYDWLINPQYSYGWAVPFLALFLVWSRWQSRPQATAPANLWPKAISGVLLATLSPVRILEEANPDWRLLSWALALLVAGYSLLAAYRAGGRTWTLHLSFPICFGLVAVPWPVRFETWVVQALTRTVAAAAVEIAGWLGIGAFQLGNVIQLNTGFVGVDEACSGVRTLQAAIMVSLFLGELLGLRPGRRIALTVVGCAWVFVCNVIRATTLVIVAAAKGLGALTDWHDTVGTVVLVAGLAGLLLFAWKLKADSDGRENMQLPVAQPPLPAARLGPLGLAVTWIAAVFVATEGWYRAHERRLADLPRWEVQWPQQVGGVVLLPIPDTTRAILRFSSAESASWQQPPGVRWWAFFAHWNAGRAAVQLVRSHSPDICLPAIGRTFRDEKVPLTVPAAGADLMFRVYEFEQEGSRLFVFVCVQEDKTAPIGRSDPEWNLQSRIRAARNGQRNLGQRLLEIAVTGISDFAAAEQQVRDVVREIVQKRVRD